jgi:nucleoid DNA-binding protein
MRRDRTGKEFLVDILRRAFITKEDANVLYDMIREECIEALISGKEVNLFELVAIRNHTTPSHSRNTFNGMMIVPERNILKARIFPRLKKEWNNIND